VIRGQELRFLASGGSSIERDSKCLQARRNIVHFARATVEALPFRAALFDAAICAGCPYIPAALQGDANAIAAGLGRLGLILASLQNGKANGAWELKLPADANVTSGAFTARANRTDAMDRPLFVVTSATEAIALEKIGAFQSVGRGHRTRRHSR
jgi:hypothetical protein